MGKLDLSAGNLDKTAHKYRKEFLMMPVKGIEHTAKHMSVRPGIRYKETVGELSGDIQLGPYSESREDDTDVIVNPRDLETYFGSVVKNFSPNAIVQSIWGSAITKGEGLKNTEVVKLVVAYLSKQLGMNLNKVIWSAKRNAAGDKSQDLFNGFDTITATELTASNIDVSKGNLFIIPEKISPVNAVEQLKAIWRAADDELQEVPTKLIIPKFVYNAYNDDYQATVGSVPYNKEFKKTFLEGTDDLCELVPLANKKGTKYIHLTTKKNMLIGVNQTGEEEQIAIEKHKAFVLQFIATMFFGVQFETISKERFLVAKMGTDVAI